MSFATLRRPLAAAVLMCLGAAAQAFVGPAVSSFQGNFLLDDDLAVFEFDLASVGDITAQTFSHGGGTNGAGTSIAAGGFAPVLALFDASGALVQDNIGAWNQCAVDVCWDAWLSVSDALPGHYTLVLSQDENFNGSLLSDPYSQAGEHHYTAGFLGSSGDPGATFIRFDGAQRTGHWALDVTVAAVVTQVPEPASAWLLAAGLAAVGLRRRARAA